MSSGRRGRDLGGVLTDVKPSSPGRKIVAARELDHASRQAETMNSSFMRVERRPADGGRVDLFLLVINFQGWLDPFIILTALTGALAGVAWGLYLTATS